MNIAISRHNLFLVYSRSHTVSSAFTSSVCFWCSTTLFSSPVCSVSPLLFYSIPILIPSYLSVVFVSLFGSDTNPRQAGTPPLAHFLVNHNVCVFSWAWVYWCYASLRVCQHVWQSCCIDFAERGCIFLTSLGLQVFMFDGVLTCEWIRTLMKLSCRSLCFAHCMTAIWGVDS